MMIYFIALVLMVSVFEIWRMVKKQQNREIVVFIIIAVLTLGMGFFYISNPYRESFAQQILRILGKQF